MIQKSYLTIKGKGQPVTKPTIILFQLYDCCRGKIVYFFFLLSYFCWCIQLWCIFLVYILDIDLQVYMSIWERDFRKCFWNAPSHPLKGSCTFDSDKIWFFILIIPAEILWESDDLFKNCALTNTIMPWISFPQIRASFS